MSYAVRDFYLNGGAQAIIVRLFKAPDDTDGAATITIGNLNLVAASPGAWGTTLRVKTDVAGITAEVAARFGLALSATSGSEARKAEAWVKAELMKKGPTSPTAPRTARATYGGQPHELLITTATVTLSIGRLSS